MCRVNFHGYEISCLIYSSFDSVGHFFFLFSNLLLELLIIRIRIDFVPKLFTQLILD